ncbi:Malate/(S)-sulfolactate dehydrogenase [Cyphellophora attinorum]|uniref:Malate/(S)-sulfolactate dehydrogenase n=1 Tax=Cyphellophora attinorum TaxID=1664694 RepID=A0A0N1HTF3_9EURO|nr:Malate/(S)-sulfolactate dehydrogenase [Phialophora attinorum]KPI42285.1 Malate/(S)-sulfolactate dehydrogenase [Phialophora attinorum]
MKISTEDGHNLVSSALQKIGYTPESTKIIADHLIDSELRGYGVAGLARALSIADRLAGKPPAQTTKTTRSAPATAQIDGQDTLGYLVAYEATQVAIAKAKSNGVSAVGASGTWYTGMLSYYAEMAAKEDLVAIIASNCTAWVAPEGGYRPIFGTNPWCVGFPTGDGQPPVIYDIGTSKILHADVLLANRLGRELPPDSVFDKDGNDTVSPQDALSGALKVWGGHRGSGLAITVQLLGVMAGSAAFPPDLAGFGYMIVMVDPAQFRPIEEFKAEVDAFSKAMREGPALDKGKKLRMPFERSFGIREEGRNRGEFEVEDGVVERLKKLIDG